MAAATPGITYDFYQEKERKKEGECLLKKGKQTNKEKETIPDIHLPLIGKNFVKNCPHL